MDRDCFSLDEFAERNGIGLTTAYLEIKTARLQARKVGRRTLIAVEDAKAWREQLPKVVA
jgi:hypothetical protein